MESVNEQIAKIMQWEVLPPDRIWTFRDKNRRTFSLHHIECAKRLQQRMVDDGHQFYFSQDDEHGTSTSAFTLKDGKEWDEISVHLKTHSPNDELAAIVELFCKCYGISK
ncbi:MAG: hypothetical protein WC341_17230 [Bacteroidales bacterium]|jgi:hypothetical protein